jgi:predicted CoA-substrate-specific enzyme activase
MPERISTRNLQGNEATSPPRKTGAALGLCLGACAITIARQNGGDITFGRMVHDGKVAEVLRGILETSLPAKVVITGRGFRNMVTIATISEPEAIELAYGRLRHACPRIDCIVSAGGETFIAYALDRQGKIRSVQTGDKCASGTGEFFLQQINRMGLALEEAMAAAVDAEPYQVASRCSVFCKSDCTHAMNKGVSKGRISAGLCRMMAEKITNLVKKARASRVLITGGVSKNRIVLEYLRQHCPEALTIPQSPFFEALGALIKAQQEGALLHGDENLFNGAHSAFTFLPPLTESLAKVHFASMNRGVFMDGDYVLGLDVGSTTTKAVLLRTDTHEICADIYLRTNGDPIDASRRCYRAIQSRIPANCSPRIIGIGTTGSGRQIAGLHAQTACVINEIVAHAIAAVFFDPEVETIFEIGGQDAKYTFITNRVASDYAMNEACSAGTGSFLEEACLESLGFCTKNMEAAALRAMSPPDFNDQCAAFIGSDIKIAVQEGIGKEDIVAGLVYSVCRNYLHRVKGSRPLGRKIFMQGGVCYNRAVPAAMATLCGRQIVVPPEPGLMGAFGVALEVLHGIGAGRFDKGSYRLDELAERPVIYREPFVCKGNGQGCDRKCTIARIEVNGTIFPFGGACDRYSNPLRKTGMKKPGLDLVRWREDLVFGKYAPPPRVDTAPAVGIPAALLTNTLYPFYATFFSSLGLRVVLGIELSVEGMDARGASFCYPVLLSHGFTHGLLQRDVDYIFLPRVKSLAVENSATVNCTCPFVQADPDSLRATFHDALGPRFLTEVLEFDRTDALRVSLRSLAARLGFSASAAHRAFTRAQQVFDAMRSEMLETGQKFLRDLHPDEIAIVLFGRPYNAFSRFGNMGIPHKFASRGYRVIPHDFLPLAALGVKSRPGMYWATGQGILQAADFVASTPNLFGVFITNFSCGPDSFITGYFRDIMGSKPSLTLEIDAHTADAGIDTRIEAFLDVIGGYRGLRQSPVRADGFAPARMVAADGQQLVETAGGRRYPLTDPNVHLLFPSMGDSATRCLAAVMRFAGIRATTLPPAGRRELSLGRGLASCKECLPLILTTGSLAHYLGEFKRQGEVIVYFMPQAEGPCRFGQYNVFMKNHIRKNRIADVALLCPSSRDGYGGFPEDLSRRAWLALCLGDGLEEIRAGMLALAEDPERAMEAFARAQDRIVASLARDRHDQILNVVKKEMAGLAAVRRTSTLEQATRIALVGEIFVRQDGFSRHYLVEKLAKKGIVVKTAPITEWIHYIDYCVAKGLIGEASCGKRFVRQAKNMIMRRDERRIGHLLARTGFADGHRIGVDYLVSRGSSLLNSRLTGEAILTISATLTEIGDFAHGVISIGPFSCMPSRIAEAILAHRLVEEKENFSLKRSKFWAAHKGRVPLPFLAIETDGHPFPQLVEIQLENFVLAANRLKDSLRSTSTEGKSSGGHAAAIRVTRNTRD